MSTHEEQLLTWVCEEQVILWHDLSHAIRNAINGAWSIQAGYVACRIVNAARLVGPTPHGEVLWPLVAGGVYEAVLAAGGITPDLPDEQEWQRLEARHGTRATLRPKLAATVAAINTDRERARISGGNERHADAGTNGRSRQP